MIEMNLKQQIDERIKQSEAFLGNTTFQNIYPSDILIQQDIVDLLNNVFDQAMNISILVLRQYIREKKEKLKHFLKNLKQKQPQSNTLRKIEQHTKFLTFSSQECSLISKNLAKEMTVIITKGMQQYLQIKEDLSPKQVNQNSSVMSEQLLNSIQQSCEEMVKKNGIKNASEVFKLLIEEREKNGRFHAKTLQTKLVYANFLRSQKKYQEALKIDYEVIEGRINSLGEEHPDTLKALYNYSNSLRELKKFKNAKKILERIVLVGNKFPQNELQIINLAQKRLQHFQSLKQL